MSAAADFVIRHRALQRYILADEKVVVATRRHWARLWEPILTTTGAFVLGLAILVAVDPDVRDGLAWVWLPFLVLGLRLLYKWLDWRAEWFVMTDRRLILLTGLLVHRVAMMPSEKVTDLGYERTPLGQVLGYGTFVFETAGQDQAFDRVTWIPRPDSRYRLIIATLFHPDAADAEAAAQSGPDFRPQAVPPAEPAPAAPPALMPRIGRRSNPPTQRIEVPALRDLASPGSGTTSDGAPSGSVSSGGAISGGVSSGGASSGGVLPGGVRSGGTLPDDVAGGTGAGGSGTGGSGTGGSGTGGDEPAGATRPSTNGTPPVAAASGSGRMPGRTSDGKGGDHVPGGPTSATDGSDALPRPFIEGGKDPKIR
ncbi:PH domain-containing protein [Promicromonospora sp. NPDC019610]|uniref:PH domain-containing protein n=1 Tax=Promicromonospora sp. NPDC019610 TaxID=3364405 RepID=UPI0037B37B26